MCNLIELDQWIDDLGRGLAMAETELHDAHNLGLCDGCDNEFSSGDDLCPVCAEEMRKRLEPAKKCALAVLMAIILSLASIFAASPANASCTMVCGPNGCMSCCCTDGICICN